MKSGLDKIYRKIESGKRISLAEGKIVLTKGSLSDIGFFAQKIRYRFHPSKVVTYIVDRNINYTNICSTKCGFCAFYRNESDCDSYVLTKEEMQKKIEETVKLGGTGILLQGGHNPKLPFNYYKELLKEVRKNFPKIHIHAFSPPEIIFFAKNFKMPVEKVITELKKCGLRSIPGGGAEILSDKTRKTIAPQKATSRQWLYVMRKAHQLNIPSTATMMFGTCENDDEIVLHLEKIRKLQDKTKGFTAFIPWTYQKGGKAKIDAEKTSYAKYLKVLGFSRIYLDNIKNIQASWLTQGLDVASVALHYGANDVGSVMIEENVVREAGCLNRTNEEELKNMILDSGFIPKKRTTLYKIIED
ncbi:MAG: dehypoxanthine futalosine cyclase [Acidobacteria bacterium]|nr:dehypoxanthine futalosine cyclase [Acidobacteriota bacterium]